MAISRACFRMGMTPAGMEKSKRSRKAASHAEGDHRQVAGALQPDIEIAIGFHMRLPRGVDGFRCSAGSRGAGRQQAHRRRPARSLGRMAT